MDSFIRPRSKEKQTKYLRKHVNKTASKKWEGAVEKIQEGDAMDSGSCRGRRHPRPALHDVNKPDRYSGMWGGVLRAEEWCVQGSWGRTERASGGWSRVMSEGSTDGFVEVGSRWTTSPTRSVGFILSTEQHMRLMRHCASESIQCWVWHMCWVS